ncbi:TBC1 domain family member 5-like isoform X2 [Apostichopus japonicus]|uniref:TBC1 domain family member 5-like isoform X2 n=1 Tax=Stichopus japonicus TaxID=307972 RepID=UPI003AB7704C
MTKKSPSSDDIHEALDYYGNQEDIADPLNAASVRPDALNGLKKGDSGLLSNDDGSDFLVDNEEDNDGGSQEGTMSKSTSTSYQEEWLRLFECKHFDSYIRKEAMKGKLRNCTFRSLCWRVFLKCLSTNVSNWGAEVKASRDKYNKLLHRVMKSPESELKDESLDVSLNNPLCQSEDSPWQRFFEDKKNKGEIQQDIDRCFQEIALFQKPAMQTMMLNILFCYAKENPETSYKQGMHEILAPLIFVLHSDQQAYLHAKEMESLLPLAGEILDPAFLEHDSYTLFSRLMETMKPWFQYGKLESGNSRLKKPVHAAPFAMSEDDLLPSTPLAIKIQRIYDVILKKNDVELYTHLSRLDIPPQVYGLKWVRLLFGREFMFQDLLVLWDALFADSTSLELIDYFFVAMMMLVRELLLGADSLACLTLLMHFPTSGDIHFLINKALHLRDPLNHARPHNYQFKIFHQSKNGNYFAQTLPRRMESKRSPSPQKIAFKDKTNAAVASGFNSLKRMTRTSASERPTKEERPNRMVKSSTYGDIPHPLFQSTDEDLQVQSKPLSKKTVAAPLNRVESFFGKPRSNSKTKEKEESESQKELMLLKGRMNDTQNMCKYCATKMEAHILQIQDALENHKLPEEDTLLMALAGLKQVKDILGGTLRFAQGSLEEDGIKISDNYFSEESDGGASVKHFDQSRETFLQEDDDTGATDEEPHVNSNGHVNKETVEDTVEADPLGVN